MEILIFFANVLFFFIIKWIWTELNEKCYSYFPSIANVPTTYKKGHICPTHPTQFCSAQFSQPPTPFSFKENMNYINKRNEYFLWNGKKETVFLCVTGMSKDCHWKGFFVHTHFILNQEPKFVHKISLNFKNEFKSLIR